MSRPHILESCKDICLHRFFFDLGASFGRFNIIRYLFPFDDFNLTRFIASLENRSCINNVCGAESESLGKLPGELKALFNICCYLMWTGRFVFMKPGEDHDVIRDLVNNIAERSSGEHDPVSACIDQLAEGFKPKSKDELDAPWKPILSKRCLIQNFIGNLDEGKALGFFKTLGFGSIPLIIFAHSKAQLEAALSARLPRNALFVYTGCETELTVPSGASLQEFTPTQASAVAALSRVFLRESVRKKEDRDVSDLLDELCGDVPPGELSLALGIPRSASESRRRLNNIVFFTLNKYKAEVKNEPPGCRSICTQTLPSEPESPYKKVVLHRTFEDWLGGRIPHSAPMGDGKTIRENLDRLSEDLIDELCAKFKEILTNICDALWTSKPDAVGLLIEDVLAYTVWQFFLLCCLHVERDGLPDGQAAVRLPRGLVPDALPEGRRDPDDGFSVDTHIISTKPPEILDRPLANQESMCKVGINLGMTVTTYLNELLKDWSEEIAAAVKEAVITAVEAVAQKTHEPIAYLQVRGVLKSEERRTELRQRIEDEISRRLSDTDLGVVAAKIYDEIVIFLEKKYPPIKSPGELSEPGLFLNTPDAPASDLLIITNKKTGDGPVPCRVGVDCKRSEKQPKKTKGEDFNTYIDQQHKARGLGLDLLVSFRLTALGRDVSKNIPRPGEDISISHIGAGHEIIGTPFALFLGLVAPSGK
eukprot:gnl/Chilomastix_cuspidata/3557.p1 GENE.gnl/Chilomastix_cuspidata/3557~~gnl/Chilomastix_cuspidata/3557.p1  ORF type:complete len:713 (-),score=77.23 gnl/Chilomastix_cuspidata/3557:72-2189(-)